MYSLDVLDIVVQVIPSFLRSAAGGALTRMSSWARALASPLQELNDTFSAWAASEAERLNWNGQTMVMERALNYRFPNPGDLIYIGNVNSSLAINYIFQDSESRPDTYIYALSESQPPFYNNRSADYAADVDFIVYVPSTLAFDASRMGALVDSLKIAGTTYSIELY